MCGICGMAILLGISPNLLSMVSTGNSKKYTSKVASTMATNEPGILVVMR